jgi:dephospho-CoA kinase
MRRPLVVGICGGIGSGKTTAARHFARLGARVLDADALAHQVLEEPGVVEAVRSRFGPGVVAGGAVDRAALRKEVFGRTAQHDRARADLEAILHPRILARIEAGLREARTESPPPPPVVVIDAPLLTEGPLRKVCDEIVFVEAPEDVRLRRTSTARQWLPEEHRMREKAQSSVGDKRAAATVTIVNSGTIADLERACDALWRDWTRPG